jgi:hypothetical protein
LRDQPAGKPGGTYAFGQRGVEHGWQARWSEEGGSVGQLGALYAIWLREVKRALRDRGQPIGGLSRPILWVILLGIGLNPYFRSEVRGEARLVVPYTYLQFIFPAVIVRNVLYTLRPIRRASDPGSRIRLSARNPGLADAAFADLVW